MKTGHHFFSPVKEYLPQGQNNSITFRYLLQNSFIIYYYRVKNKLSNEILKWLQVMALPSPNYLKQIKLKQLYGSGSPLTGIPPKHIWMQDEFLALCAHCQPEWFPDLKSTSVFCLRRWSDAVSFWFAYCISCVAVNICWCLISARHTFSLKISWACAFCAVISVWFYGFGWFCFFTTVGNIWTEFSLPQSLFVLF